MTDTTDTTDTNFRMPIELDSRTQDGFQVSLLWQPGTDVVLVEVDDERAGQRFQLVVDGAEALDVFRHPFAYAAHRGIPLVEREIEQLAA
jgi:hypothetical protein